MFEVQVYHVDNAFFAKKNQLSTMYCYEPPFSSKIHKEQISTRQLQPKKETIELRKNENYKIMFLFQKDAKDFGCILQNFSGYFFRNIIQHSCRGTYA